MRFNNSFSILPGFCLFLGLLVSEPLHAATNALVANGGAWNTASSWSLSHVPTNSETVLITEGYTVSVPSIPLNSYTGDLIIQSNATFTMGGTVPLTSCMPSAAGRVFLYEGALISGGRLGPDGSTMTVSNDFVLSGTSGITRSSYNVKVFFTGVWSGTGGMTFSSRSYQARANDGYNFTGSASNTYSGGTVIQSGSPGGDVDLFYANSDGCFGTGDVTVNSGMQLRLNGSTTDTIADAAKLFINDANINVYNNNETVGELFLDGGPCPAGTYTSSKLAALLGSGTLTVLSPTDSTPPGFGSFTNDVADGPVAETDHLINYTVTFTDDFDLIDPTTVTSADFANAGTATVSFGPVTQLSGTSFNLIVYIESAGTIQLEINAGANIEDLGGNPLDTASAITDATVITVTPFTPPGDASRMVPVLDGVSTPAAADNPIVVNFDASGSDKLVVTVTGEHGFAGNLGGDCTAITYDGVSLTKAVERQPIATSPSGPVDQLYNDIWYLDDPGSVHTGGVIIATVTTRGVLTAFGLSNVAPGVGGTAVSAQELKYVRLGAEYKKSIVIATHGMGGDGNTANVESCDAVSPLVETSAIRSGGQYNGHVTGLFTNIAQGIVIPTFTGGNTVGTHTIAAEFPALPSPGLIVIIK